MIDPKLLPLALPERGYWLNFSPNPNHVQHDFCGSHTIPGATCPHCSKPLLRLLSLSSKDPVLIVEEAKTPVVHLVYCWTCSIPFGDFSYKIGADGSIGFIEVPARKPESEFGPDGPYDGYTGAFPLCKVSLESLTESEHLKLAARQTSESDEDDDELFEPRHQVGGYPFIYNQEKTICPLCSKDMPLLAAICDDATGNSPWQVGEADSFTGNGAVQMVFHFCRDYLVLSAYHSCD